MAYPGENEVSSEDSWLEIALSNLNKKLTPPEEPPTTSLYGLAKGLPPDEEGRKIEQQTLKQMEGFGEGVSDYTERQVEELKTKPLEALAKGFGYSGATGLGKAAVAGRVGTAVTGAATPLMGPYAVIPGVIAGGAAYYGLGQAQQAIEPEPIKQLRQEVPTTMATSEFVGAMAQPLVKMPKFTPKSIPAAPTISGTPALTERPMIEMIKGSEGVYRPQTAFDIFKENVSGRIRSAAGKVSSLPPEEVYGLAKDAIKFGTQSFDEFRALAKVNQLGLPEEVLKNAFTQAVASSLKTPETMETPKPTTLPTAEVTTTEPIATEPPATPPSEPPLTPTSEPPIQKPKRPEDIQPTWTLGERSRMNVVNVNFGDDAEILGRVNRKVFGEKLPPEDQDMKLAFEQNRQKLNATKENTERTLAQGIYDQAKNSELVKPGQSFGSFEQEFNEFLHFNHATARNAKNAEILNEKGEPVTTSGSGLTDENVSEYFLKLDPKKREAFQSIYNEQIKPILKGELEALKNAGKINEESFTNLNRYIDEGNYVPLVRDFANAPDYAKPLVRKKSGSGAKIVASKGSQLEVDNPLANILIKSNRAAETLAKEETKRTAYRLFVNNPNPEVAVVVDPTTRVETKNRLEAMGLEEKQMESILDGIYGSDVEYVYINPKTNKAYGKEELAQIKKNDPELFESLDKEKRLIYEREKLNGYDNVVPVNIEGKNSYIVFNPKAPEGQGQEIADLLNGKVEQYKELAILKYSGLVNNYLSALYTKYTPAFAYRNLPRDWQGAAVQINKTPLVGKYDEVAGNATAAIPTIASESYKMLKFGTLKPNPNDPTSVLFGQFVEDGGYLSYTKMLQDSTQTTKSLIDKLNKISKSDTKLGMATGGSYNPFTWLYESIIGPMNNVSELSLRFGAYKTALDNGFSRDRATQISRDISLNLARSGKIIKNELKGFELFLGPRIAGAKQFGGFTTKGGQKLLVDLMALGVLQQALFDKTGESDNKQLNRLSENGNVVIPTGHDDDGNANYVKFPLSEIFDVPMQFGRSLYRGTRNVQKDQQALLTALWNETGAVSKKVYGAIPLAPSLDFMNIRGAGTFGPVPSAFEPIVNALRNRDTFTGLPISPKVYDDTVPGYQRSSIKSSLTANAIAEAINNLTGKTRNVAGRLSPTADQIDYVVKGYAGPFYSIPKQIAEAFPQNKLTSYVFRNMNQENDWRKLPILNIFLGKATEQKEQEIRYYENLERFTIHSTELGVERKEDRPDMKEYISDYISRNPDAKIADPSTSYSVTNDLKDAVKEVTEANREIREIAKSEEYKENPDKFINNIEKLNQKIYKNQSKFNRAYQRVIDRYGTE